MEIVELILLGVNSISTLLKNPALGGGSSVRLDEASELLGMLAMLVAEGDDAYDDLKEFTTDIKAMAEQGTSPTRTQWANMRAREQSAHDRLQRVKEELLGEDLRTEAEAARQAIVEEIATLEAIAPEDLTDEQRVRLEELTAPPSE